jgi:hypothetical protein
MMTDETTLIILMGKGESTFILPREIESDEENGRKKTTNLQQHLFLK